MCGHGGVFRALIYNFGIVDGCDAKCMRHFSLLMKLIVSWIIQLMGAFLLEHILHFLGKLSKNHRIGQGISGGGAIELVIGW